MFFENEFQEVREEREVSDVHEEFEQEDVQSAQTTETDRAWCSEDRVWLGQDGKLQLYEQVVLAQKGLLKRLPPVICNFEVVKVDARGQ